jgi:hypothetical protein
MIPIPFWILALMGVASMVLTFQAWRWGATLRYMTKPIDGPIPEGERVTLEGKIRAGPELVPAPHDPDRMCVAWVARAKDPSEQDDTRHVRIKPFVLERTNGESIWLVFTGVHFFPARTGEEVVNHWSADKATRLTFMTGLGHAWNERQRRYAEIAKTWGDDSAPQFCPPELFKTAVIRFLVTTYAEGDTITVTGSFRAGPLDGSPPTEPGTSDADLPAYAFTRSERHKAAITKGSYAEARSLRNPINRVYALYTLMMGPCFFGLVYCLLQIALLLSPWRKALQ